MPRGRKTKYFISDHPLTLEGELADKLTFVKEESRRLRSGKKTIYVYQPSMEELNDFWGN